MEKEVTLIFKDYMGRELTLFTDDWERIIKDAEKHSMLDGLEVLFGDPNEVYWDKISDEPEVFHWKFFRFYSDAALVGIATTDDDPSQLYIIDWYILRPEMVDTPEGLQNNIDLARYGMLLYNKNKK